MESLERSARLRKSSSLQSKSHPEEALVGCAILALLKIRLVKPCICCLDSAYRFTPTTTDSVTPVAFQRNAPGPPAWNSPVLAAHGDRSLNRPRIFPRSSAQRKRCRLPTTNIARLSPVRSSLYISLRRPRVIRPIPLDAPVTMAMDGWVVCVGCLSD
jgi:hypothetical protein